MLDRVPLVRVLPRIALAASLAAAVAAPFAPRAALADDADALLAKHKAYVGWQAGDGVVKTLRESGTVSRDAKAYRRIAMTRYGVAFRESSQSSQGFTQDDGFTGNVFWTSDDNGFTVRPVGESVRYRIADQAVFSELTAAFAGKVLRNERVGDVDTTVVRLTSQYSLPIDVYVDPSTGAYARIVIDPDGKYEDAINGIGYKTVDGKRFMATWHYGRSKSVYAYDAIEVNPAIEPDSLRPPKQTATWTFGGDSVPVSLDDNTFPRLYIELVVNGVKGRFMLDTGAGGTVMVDSFARRVGAKRVGATHIYGIGGEAAANVFTVDTVAFGHSVLHDLRITSGLDERWNEGEDAVVGLVGFDMLAGAIVDLDLDAKTLRIMDPTAVKADETGGIVLHPDLSTHDMRVPMKLNGQHDVIATLDSGNPINVLFSSDMVSQNHVPFMIDPNQLGSTRYGGGIGGEEIEHCGKLQSLELGPIAYRPVPACDSPSFSRNEVLVGLDFMKNFNFTFDYPDDVVVIRPRKQ